MRAGFPHGPGTRGRSRRNWIEFLRFGIVGFLSFLVDFGTLFLLRETVFSDSVEGLYLATLFAFLAGLAFNTALAVRFVFRDPEVVAKGRGKSAGDLLHILAIGMAGLLLTELGMHLGISLLGEGRYLAVKVAVTLVVMFWNYFARKIWVFR